MARKNLSWFEFKEMRSDLLGVRLMDTHLFSLGGARGSQESVSGRSGYIWNGDGALEGFEIERICRSPASRLREISAWLCGSGGLRFSQEQGMMYDARVIQAVSYRQAVPGRDPLYEFRVTFTCQPFAHMWPEPLPMTFTSPSGRLLNQGTAPALPRVEIVGSGDFSVGIGKQVVYFSGVEGGIIVDSELGDALTLDGAAVANERMDGELFEIQPGDNAVYWQEGGISNDGTEASGRVEKVIITPRWRYI